MKSFRKGSSDGTYSSDGVKEQVGWVKVDDGLLTLDKNNNGTVDNILELFGKTNKTGTEELREYDLNNDGVINSSDAVFSNLKVWQDVNQDGISQSSELKTLSQLGITSINVSEDSLTTLNQNNQGNLILSQGSYTKSDGTTKIYANLDLSVNQTNSVSYSYDDSGNVIGDYDLDLSVLSLPMIRGYGDVKALPIAASLDSDLLTLLQNLKDIDATDYRNIDSTIEEIIFKWSGTSDISATQLRGLFSDQKLSAMENFRGQDFLNANGGNSVINAIQYNAVSQAWETLFAEIKSKLLVQSAFKDIFSYSVTTTTPASTQEITNEDGTTSTITIPESTTTTTYSPTYDFSTDSIDFNDISLDQISENITQKISDISNTASTATDAETKDKINSYLTIADRISFLLEIKEVLTQINSAQSSAIQNLNSTNLENLFSEIEQEYFSDVAFGSNSGDTINSDSQSIFIGGKGDDKLVGLADNDVYLFNKGDGADTIDEVGNSTENASYTNSYGTDKIVFGADITKENITLTRSADNLIIKFTDSTTDQITINKQFSVFNKIESLQFANGDVIDLTDDSLQYSIFGTSAADNISGSASNDTITGYNGNDTIESLQGDDILIGGLGDDILRGKEGNDTYIFNLGDGKDTIAENYTSTQQYSGTDTIQLAQGITESDVYYSRTGSDLIIKFRSSPNDQITIKDQFSFESTQVENLKFTNQKIENGVAVVDENGNPILETSIVDLVNKDWSQVVFEEEGSSSDDYIYATGNNNIINTYAGNDTVTINSGNGSNTIDLGAGNDTLNGSGGNDTITGGLGDDTLYGDGGNDTYIFNLGDGKDFIIDASSSSNYNNGTDTLSFGLGITQENIITSKSGDNFVIKFSNSPNDQITLKDYFASGTAQKIIELVKFSTQNSDNSISTSTFNFGDVVRLQYEGTASDNDVSTNNSLASQFGDIIKTYGGNDSINSAGGNDYIDAGDGNDSINSGSGDDVIIAGKGDDSIIGFTGNFDGNYGDDTYIFNLGDGKDVIAESAAYSSSFGNDVIQFGSGLNKADVYFAVQNTYDLVVKFKNNSSDQITIQNHLRSTGDKIETLKFSDGSTLNLTSQSVINSLITTEISGSNNADTISGTIYRDIIHGNGGNDTINGSNGADELYGDAGNDNLNGSDGNDILVGGTGDDWLIDGSGDETYIYNLGDGKDTIFESNGLDKITFGEGISSSDIYFQKESDYNVIIKFRNNDTDQITLYRQLYTSDNVVEKLEFFDGSSLDISSANNLQFELNGTSDNNYLVGSNYSDKIYGYAGNDVLIGGSGNDTYIGGSGDDQISNAATYDEGNDSFIFNLGDGKDTIYQAPSELSGSNYNLNLGFDQIQFGEGIARNNIFFTTSGNDLTITFKDNSSDQITIKNQLRSNADKVESIKFFDGSLLDISTISTANLADFNSLYDSNHNPEANFTSGVVNENSSVIFDVLASAFDVDGNALSISKISNALNGKVQIITDEFGNQKIFYTPNTDFNGSDNFTYTISDGNGGFVTKIIDVTINAVGRVIDGDYRNNTLNGTAGDDIINGYAGNDNIKGNKGSDILRGGDGNDNISGGDGNDELQGGSGNDKLYGDDGDDLLFGGDSNDSLNGGNGNDILRGEEGIDNLHGNAGNDTLYGGNGTDTLYGDEGDDTIYGEAGNDTLNGGEGSDQIFGGDGIDNLLGGAGDDTLYLGTGNDKAQGDDGDDIIYGKTGHDTLSGNSGNDQIFGGGDGDIIYGGDGNDLLEGGAGNDQLFGDAGADLLTGGSGRDTFTFNSLSDSTINEMDIILDFNRNLDKINLSDLNFTHLAFEDSLDTTTSEINTLNYHFESGNTIIEDHNSNFAIKLIGEINLSDNNFVF